MVEKDNVEWLLNQFDLGSSTAENDSLLEVAKIETQEFYDLYFYDRIDKIKGIKGAGKTALYRLFFLLRNSMIEKKKTYCIFGVEATGDPVFRLFQKEFENYNEIEFENFWGIYFIALVYKLIFNTESLKNKIEQSDVIKIDDILLKMGVKIYKPEFNLKDILCSILDYIKKHKIKTGLEIKVDSATSTITTFKPTLEFEPTSTQEISRKPIYLADFRDVIVSILGSTISRYG